MFILHFFWYAIQILVGYNLILPFFLWLLWLGRSRKRSGERVPESDYGVIVTAYEQIHMIPSVISSILNVKYSNFVVYVVADKCDVSTLKFEDPRVVVLRPAEVLASNTASHQYAIQNFLRNHKRLTIIDSDNFVDPDYLSQLDIMFNEGFSAVQGLREPKNLDTTIARLDAARDIYYHFYDGQVLFEVGSSATLSGSGMAFDTELYKSFLDLNSIKGAGFDKVLQNFVLQKNHRIAFNKLAIVYDEKTSQTDQLINQRSRWLNTWFRYFGFGFGLIGKGILHSSLNQFLFGFILLRPPLFIFLLASLIFALINIWFNPWAAVAWVVAILIFVVGFMIALLNSKTDRRIYNSLKNIPVFIYYQLLSLLKSRTANKRSVATTHYHSDPPVQIRKETNES